MWTDEQRDQIAKVITIICEMTDTQWSVAAVKTAIVELSVYPFERAKEALQRVRREHKGRLTLAAILDCLDDGYPSADEAWAMVADGMNSESLTVVIPAIAQLAAGEARTLWLNGDKFGARQAFVKAYDRKKYDSQGVQCEWVVEAGTDKEQRDMKIREAIEMGRINRERGLAYLPDSATDTRHLLLTGQRLSKEQREQGRLKTGAMLAMLADKMVARDEMR